jgi:hypothetical protein
MLKYLIAIIIITQSLMAHSVYTEYKNNVKLYNAKIEAYAPFDQTHHKAPNYKLQGKG